MSTATFNHRMNIAFGWYVILWLIATHMIGGLAFVRWVLKVSGWLP